jgi:hypothetical protein
LAFRSSSMSRRKAARSSWLHDGMDILKVQPFFGRMRIDDAYIYIHIYISNYKHHSFMMFYGVIDQLLTYSKMFKGSCYRPFKNNLHSERVSGEPSPLTSQPANLHGQVSPASTSATHRMLLGKAARKKHVEDMH